MTDPVVGLAARAFLAALIGLPVGICIGAVIGDLWRWLEERASWSA